MQAIPFTHNTNVVSRKQFDNHIMLYNGYISKTNEIDKILADNPETASANATYSSYRGTKKGETYALNGVILHELYFQNLGANQGSIQESLGEKTRRLLTGDFGSIENWREDFTACGKSARGWCVLCYEQRSGKCRNILLDAHDQGSIALAYPILVLDMYEHAYAR